MVVVKLFPARKTAGIFLLLLAGCGGGGSGVPGETASLPISELPPPQPECDDTRIAARDIAGVCRAVPTTMGALEVG